MRVALYHRVSTTGQDETLARDELRAAARTRGGDVVLDVEEIGSGARNDRPGLQRVLEAARKGKIDAVIVVRLDRWGRSALDVLGNIRALQDFGVRFVCTSQAIDVKPGAADPVSQLTLAVLASVAEFERAIIQERTRVGIEKAKRQGKTCHRPIAANAPDGSAVASLRAQGLSWAAIAAELRCTPSAARRALQRLVGTGPAKDEGVSVGA